MISFTVRMTFDPGDRERLVEVLRTLTAASRAEAGCVSYVPHFVEELPGTEMTVLTVLIYEQYKDEAAVEAHRGSPHFQQYAAGELYRMMRGRVKEDLIALA